VARFKLHFDFYDVKNFSPWHDAVNALMTHADDLDFAGSSAASSRRMEREQAAFYPHMIEMRAKPGLACCPFQIAKANMPRSHSGAFVGVEMQ
jgi:hypothetical protein